MVNRLDGFKRDLSDSFAKAKEIVTAERVINGKQMIETCKNEAGQIRKVSIFNDRNGDGKFDASEVVSVKYIETTSRSQQSVEYRDTNDDGYADEVVESDWTGNETVSKVAPDRFYGKKFHRMDFKYGFKWDSDGPMLTNN